MSRSDLACFPFQTEPRNATTRVGREISFTRQSAVPMIDNEWHSRVGCCRSAAVASQAVTMNKLSILKEFWSFLRVSKRWWLLPIVVFLLMLGAILVAAK